MMNYDQNYNQLEYQKNTGLLQTVDERQYGMFMHFSVLANMIVPFAGYVIPIVIWQTKKEEMPAIVAHGKEVVNWLITSFVFSLISIALIIGGGLLIGLAESFVFGFIVAILGVLSTLVLTVVNFGYAIYGGIQASNGEHWEYPFNFKFIK